MTHLGVFGLAAILSVAAVAPMSAQAMSDQPLVYVSNETATKPWGAPVGHRQPRATDIPSSISSDQLNLDEEDALVDRKIKGICRGC